MREPNCLTRQELAEFMHGRVAVQRSEQIVEHVESCEDCRSTVVMLGEQSDTFAGQLRDVFADASEGEGWEHERECEAAIAAAVNPKNGTTFQESGRELGLPRLIDAGELRGLGPYRIVRRLGSGGMGTVFEAVHSKLKRRAALKLLPAGRWAKPAAVARFEREMEVIGGLDHPHIVRANDAGEDQGMHYLVMEYVDGLDLSRAAERLGKLAVADVCEIGRQVAVGLAYADRNNLVHRDIKPSNLMLAAAGKGNHDANGSTSVSVKILDLGLALLNEANSANDNELTTVGQLMGTLDYMSPEQGMDSHEVDTRADIYSLGATMYRLLTGHAPFGSPRYSTLLKKVTALANQPAAPIQTLRPDIPDQLAAIIDRMLAKDATARFSSPAEVAELLALFTANADLAGLLDSALSAQPAQEDTAAKILAPYRTGSRSEPIDQGKSGSVAGDFKQPRVETKGKQRKFTLRLAAFALLPLLMLAAVVVLYVKTNRGELIIRADRNARVVVRRGDKDVAEFEVSHGDRSLEIQSGQYQIEVVGGGDELTLSRDSVVVKRGEQVVVQVLRRPSKTHLSKQDASLKQQWQDFGMEHGMNIGGMTGGDEHGDDEDLPEEMGMSANTPIGGGASGSLAQPGATLQDSRRGPQVAADPSGTSDNPFADGFGGDEEADANDPFAGSAFGLGGGTATPPQREPTYDGKTYRQWILEVQTERKPERITEAIRAFATLGDGDEVVATQSATAVMRVMRRYGSQATGFSSRDKLISEALNVMAQMPGGPVADVVREELAEGNTNSRAFINHLLGMWVHGWGKHGQQFQRAVEPHADNLCRALLDIPQSEDPDVRADAFELVINYMSSRKRKPHELDGFVSNLQSALNDDVVRMSTLAHPVVVQYEPENVDLVPALRRLLREENISIQIAAAKSSADLGPAAKPAVPELIGILTKVVGNAKQRPKQYRLQGLADEDAMMEAMEGSFGGYPVLNQAEGGFGTVITEQSVAIEAARALGNIGPAAIKALPILRKLAVRSEKAKASNSMMGNELDSAAGQMSEMYGGGDGRSQAANLAEIARVAIAKISGANTDSTDDEEPQRGSAESDAPKIPSTDNKPELR